MQEVDNKSHRNPEALFACKRMEQKATEGLPAGSMGRLPGEAGMPQWET